MRCLGYRLVHYQRAVVPSVYCAIPQMPRVSEATQRGSFVSTITAAAAIRDGDKRVTRSRTRAAAPEVLPPAPPPAPPPAKKRKVAKAEAGGPQSIRAKAVKPLEPVAEPQGPEVHVAQQPSPVTHSSRKCVGAHVSAAGGLERAVVNAAMIGARAFALDTRSKRRWESKPITDETAAAFREKSLTEFEDQAEKSYGGFLTELQNCEKLGLTLYNFHPGSTCGLCTPEEGCDRVAGAINRAHAATQGVTVVLENTAGHGSCLGSSFEELRRIIDGVEDKSRIGVCLDTCHAFSAGYDLSTAGACNAVLCEFESIVGLHYLKGIHINDSKTERGSRRDRHENIGKGTIPMDCFHFIMNDPRLDGLPLIMETPVAEKEPAVNYKKSLEQGQIVWRFPDAPLFVGTDKRDIQLLYSLCEC